MVFKEHDKNIIKPLKSYVKDLLITWDVITFFEK